MSESTNDSELKNLNNSYFSIFVIDMYLMKSAQVNGWKSWMQEVLPEQIDLFLAIFVGVYAVYIAFSWFAIKSRAINKHKVGWLRALFVVLAISALRSLFGDTQQWPLYNWADWATQATSFIQLLILYLIDKRIKSTAHPA